MRLNNQRISDGDYLLLKHHFEGLVLVKFVEKHKSIGLQRPNGDIISYSESEDLQDFLSTFVENYSKVDSRFKLFYYKIRQFFGIL